MTAGTTRREALTPPPRDLPSGEVEVVAAAGRKGGEGGRGRGGGRIVPGASPLPPSRRDDPAPRRSGSTPDPWRRRAEWSRAARRLAEEGRRASSGSALGRLRAAGAGGGRGGGGGQLPEAELSGDSSFGTLATGISDWEASVRDAIVWKMAEAKKAVAAADRESAQVTVSAEKWTAAERKAAEATEFGAAQRAEPELRSERGVLRCKPGRRAVNGGRVVGEVDLERMTVSADYAARDMFEKVRAGLAEWEAGAMDAEEKKTAAVLLAKWEGVGAKVGATETQGNGDESRRDSIPTPKSENDDRATEPAQFMAGEDAAENGSSKTKSFRTISSSSDFDDNTAETQVEDDFSFLPHYDDNFIDFEKMEEGGSGLGKLHRAIFESMDSQCSVLVPSGKDYMIETTYRLAKLMTGLVREGAGWVTKLQC